MLPDFFFFFSLFSRPRAGLATVYSSFFRVGNQRAECEKQQQQQQQQQQSPPMIFDSSTISSVSAQTY